MDEYAHPDILAVKNKTVTEEETNLPLPQWINWDLRHFEFSILEGCDVLMLDPPWDIHMNVV